MVKVDNFIYRVARGETVTLTADLQGLGPNMISVSNPMQPVAGKPLTWQMTIPDEGQDEFFVVTFEVSFVKPPKTAKAVVSVEGSAGGGAFQLPAITPKSIIKDPDIIFKAMK